MNRTLIVGLAALAVLAAIIWGGVAAIGKIESMVDKAAKTARSERDNYWRAEIEKSNAAAQAKIAENLKQTMAAQDAARDQIEAANRRADTLEKQNASLPVGDTDGIGRDRVRLLNQR
ncbi:hypothetical protein GOZ83_05180 [Agrobacterium vitis]|uniref:hypothetical protein n=1 Tax=Rhizobium/Agrobacterium group TaxID=227290 RepID=UPI0012E78BFE|nr:MULTISPECIES: hypothetical protein [Rhizobium/Agrobacterium group]MCF1492482.1 hypothetical protein [Allorhizobium ampelinum]MVA44474.1 hypothetical protein [Agrobacterium vitis]